MKQIAITFSVLFLASGLFAQTGSKELYKLFPDLPSSMSNDDFIALLSSGSELDTVYYKQLGESIAIIAEDKIYPLGQVTSGGVIHLFYATADVDESSLASTYLITTTCMSYKKSNGEVVAGGRNDYLAMTGDDALHRESSFTVNGKKIVFEITSTDKKNNSKEVKRTTYSIGKMLSFESEETE